MTSERWHRAKAIFWEALERPDDERRDYIEREVGDDAELLREVETLLRNDVAGDSFLESPGADIGARLVADSELPAPRRIGPYEIIREIASGGMGTVFLCRRDDATYRSEVAVKLIRRGMATDEIVRRFRTERQTLANLNHPCISRLLDGGTTDEEAPYLVLEYIDGEPIDRFCDGRQSTVRERLELFLKICGGVAYAHQNLVVHRDIKPANILVTREGDPKLLDFGIAKLLAPDPGEEVLTQDGARIMSPDYASPEQVAGDSITTASDVYSLGILLYELLSGHRPHRFETRTQTEFERVVCEIDPPPPSRVVTEGVERTGRSAGTIARERRSRPDRLRRLLAGDLDTIVMKALCKEPAGRYTSVEQLADDIRRYLDGVPIQARRSSLGYRLGKFARRNRTLVAASVLIMLSLLAGAISTAIKHADALEARRVAVAARAVALDKAETARRIQHLTVDLFMAGDPRDGGWSLAEALDRGKNRVETELDDRPEVRAGMERVLGDLSRNLGQYDDAERLLRSSLAIRLELGGPNSLEVAECKDSLGNLLRERGEFEAAEAMLRDALKILVQHEDAAPIDIALVENNLGMLLLQAGNHDEAGRFLRSALETRRTALGPDHRLVAYTINNLAGLRSAVGDSEGAMKLAREALAIREQTLPADHPDIAESLINLAVFSRESGAENDVESLYRRALEILRSAYGDHRRTATNMVNLASLLLDKGRRDEGRQLLDDALAMLEATVGEVHPDVAMTLNKLAELDLTSRAFVRAGERLERALQIQRATLLADDRHTALTLYNLARARVATSRLDEAVDCFEECLSIYLRVYDAGHVAVVTVRMNLAPALIKQGRADAAREQYDALLAAMADAPRLTVAEYRRQFAVTMARAALWRDALEILEPAMAVLVEELGEADRRVADARRVLEKARAELESAAEADRRQAQPPAGSDVPGAGQR